MKKKILLNGMEFMAQPVCFLIPESKAPTDDFVKDLLNENEFLYGKFKAYRGSNDTPDSVPCYIHLKDETIQYFPIDVSFNYLLDGFQGLYADYYFEGLRLTLLSEWVDIYNNSGGVDIEL
ncbi:hypothetical protein [Tenacibaculum sp.]|uniref:hypothetical protein n=1 Tax=Tenacibaculum sp. TaxID=1906242 RepID=UPI003AA945CA